MSYKSHVLLVISAILMSTNSAAMPANKGNDACRVLNISEQVKNIPAGRFGKPEEIGEVVAFLCSERASYISGVNLLVDGGLTKGIQ